MSVGQIDKIIKDKQAIYDLNVDQKINKIGSGTKLQKFEINKLPLYIQENKNSYKEWLD